MQPTTCLRVMGQMVSDQSMSVRYFWIRSWSHIVTHLVVLVGATLFKNTEASAFQIGFGWNFPRSFFKQIRVDQQSWIWYNFQLCKQTQYDRLSQQQLSFLLLGLLFSKKKYALRPKRRFDEDFLRQNYRQRAQFYIELFQMYHWCDFSE